MERVGQIGQVGRVGRVGLMGRGWGQELRFLKGIENQIDEVIAGHTGWLTELEDQNGRKD